MDWNSAMENGMDYVASETLFHGTTRLCCVAIHLLANLLIALLACIHKSNVTCILIFNELQWACSVLS